MRWNHRLLLLKDTLLFNHLFFLTLKRVKIYVIKFFKGLVGLGLLYQGTGHRHMAEVCLTELGRPPGPEMENCTDRESYSLAAGIYSN